MHTKRFNTCYKRWVQFRVGAVPCGCNSTSTPNYNLDLRSFENFCPFFTVVLDTREYLKIKFRYKGNLFPTFN